MKAKLGYSILFLLIFAISAIAHLPAAWVIERFLPAGNVEISGVSGTIWRGNAQDVKIQTPRNMPTVSLGRVTWSFNLWQLMQARLDYAVRFGQNSQMKFTGMGNVGVNLAGAYMRDTHLSIPAEQVLNFIELPMPVEVAGQGQLSIEYWAVSFESPNSCIDGHGLLTWSDAQVDSIAGLLDVNLVNADIDCRAGQTLADNRVEIVATQQSNDFSSTLNLDLDPLFNYQLDSSLTPNSSFPSMFKQGLDMFAQQDGQGRYTYQMSGRLPQ